MSYELFAEVTRNGVVESRYFGAESILVAALLEQLSVLSEIEKQKLRSHIPPQITNYRNFVMSEIRSVVPLENAPGSSQVLSTLPVRGLP